MNRSTAAIYAILAVASCLLGLGLVAPCMTIQPSMGETFDTWLQLLEPSELEPTTYSILGGILELMQTDSLALGLVLLAFSVVFPAFKLATLWWALNAQRLGQAGRAALWFTHHAGKFSMLDVMVIAVLVVAIKGLPGETKVAIGWGLFAFAVSVVLSIIASLLLKRTEQTPAEATALAGASQTPAR
ncbi:MAG: paraquat-inducible protein A [Planctomycetota bacterium]